MIRQLVEQELKKTLELLFPAASGVRVLIEKPAQAHFGHFACNIAMILAKQVGQKPREVAEAFQKNLMGTHSIFESVDVAGPGFLNLTLKKEVFLETLPKIVEAGTCFGKHATHSGQTALVEYVSANPTGPLHIGNARGGPVGDAVASLLEAVGYKVTREFYVNDVGGQIEQLGKTIYKWMTVAGATRVEDLGLGEKEGYRGDYVRELAERAFAEGVTDHQLPEAEAIRKLGLYGMACLQTEIAKDCHDMRIFFDSWIYEKDILPQTASVIDQLKKTGLTVEKDGAIWFIPHDEFIEDRECVLVKSDGKPTYFANDITYHLGKYDRGFDVMLNIWGSNHHGHIPRLQAAMKALGQDPAKLETSLYQYVRVKRGDSAVKMSKRGGNFVLAREVLDEVGADAIRFFLLMRAPESHLDFDLELAKSKSSDNPVYYIQYAHARIGSVLEKSSQLYGEYQPQWHDDFKSVLGLPEEIEIIQNLWEYPDVVALSARDRTPHRITYFLLDLARQFQHYYDCARSDEKYKMVVEEARVRNAKLYLLLAIKQVLANALGLLKISAPQKM